MRTGQRRLTERLAVELVKLRHVLNHDRHSEFIARRNRDFRQQRVHRSQVVKLVQGDQHFVTLVRARPLVHQEIVDLLEKYPDDRTKLDELGDAAGDKNRHAVAPKLPQIKVRGFRRRGNQRIVPGVHRHVDVEHRAVSGFRLQGHILVEAVDDPSRQQLPFGPRQRL